MGALANGISGFYNTAIGYFPLGSSNGWNNIAIGALALSDSQTGNNNIAIGENAGDTLTSGSHNVYIASPAISGGESGTIRVGAANQGKAFIAGIRGVATGLGGAIPVLIDGDGQLGTTSSTRRVKEDISDLSLTHGEVLRLRPVEFRYTQVFADGSKPIQYGLIAEEVEQVLPELVAYDANGQPASVKYHVLPTLLLAEIQRLERERASLAKEIVQLREQM